MFGFKKITLKLDEILSKVLLARIDIDGVIRRLDSIEKISTEALTTANSALAISNKISEERQKLFFEKRNIIKFGQKIKCATHLTIPDDGNAFNVTGPGSIKSLIARGAVDGECIILFFDSNGIINNNTESGDGNRIILSKSANFNFAPGNALTLIFDGEKWIEVSRS